VLCICLVVIDYINTFLVGDVFPIKVYLAVAVIYNYYK